MADEPCKKIVKRQVFNLQYCSKNILVRSHSVQDILADYYLQKALLNFKRGNEKHLPMMGRHIKNIPKMKSADEKEISILLKVIVKV